VETFTGFRGGQAHWAEHAGPHKAAENISNRRQPIFARGEVLSLKNGYALS
jgi:hypothetical protein